MMTENKPINNLAVLDSYFGLLATVAAIREQTKGLDQHMFDVHKFLIKLRQNMALQEAFCGKCHQGKKSTLYSFTKPDFLLFEKGINYSNLDSFVSDIFTSITDKLCEHITTTDQRYHTVTKNQSYFESLQKQIQEHPHLDESIKSWIDTNQEFVDDVTLSRFSAIPNPHNFKKRIEITNRLASQLAKININDYVKKKKPRLDKKMLDSYSCLYTIPLVGTLREYPDQTVLYVMSYYQKKYDKTEELANISIYMDKLLPFILKNDPEIKNNIKQCIEMSGVLKKECIITKLLARKNGSSEICVIFFVTFLNAIKRGKQSRLPLNNLYSYFRNYLQDEWEIYMRGYVRFFVK